MNKIDISIKTASILILFSIAHIESFINVDLFGVIAFNANRPTSPLFLFIFSYYAICLDVYLSMKSQIRSYTMLY